MQELILKFEQFNKLYKSKLDGLCLEFDRLNELLTYQEVLLDSNLTLSYQKRLAVIEPVVLKYKSVMQDYQGALNFYSLKDEVALSEKEAFFSAINESCIAIINQLNLLSVAVELLEAELENCVVEVVSNKAGVNNVLFSDLITAYKNFCKKHDIDFVEDVEQNNTKLFLSGLNAYNFFKEEIGVHILTDNKQEYVCNVFVYKDLETQDFNEKDVEFKASRSSGAGGQHVNTTDSSIRATHLPTGISVVCEDERSQLQNKVRALENLKEKVYETFKVKLEAEIEKQKKEQLKKIKNNFVVKNYSKLENKIIKSDKIEIAYSEFLNGNIL